MSEDIKKGKYDNILFVVKILYVWNLMPLIPCAYVTMIEEVNWIWTIPIIILRCFYIPYIASAVLSVLYFVLLYKKKFPKKETILFIVLFIICVLGLLSVERIFWAAMSV